MLPEDSGYRETLETRLFYPDRKEMEREIADSFASSIDILGNAVQELYKMILNGEPGMSAWSYDDLCYEYASRFASAYE